MEQLDCSKEQKKKIEEVRIKGPILTSLFYIPPTILILFSNESSQQELSNGVLSYYSPLPPLLPQNIYILKNDTTTQIFCGGRRTRLIVGDTFVITSCPNVRWVLYYVCNWCVCGVSHVCVCVLHWYPPLSTLLILGYVGRQLASVLPQ